MNFLFHTFFETEKNTKKIMAESIFKDNFRVPFKNIQSKKGG